MVVRHIVLAGGGTAGHVNPLLAVAQALRSSDAQNDIVVVGTHEGLEQRLVPAQGFTLETIDKVPFPRRPNKQAFTFFKRFKRAVNDSIAILQKNHAQVVVGFGGYASAPVYVADTLTVGGAISGNCSIGSCDKLIKPRIRISTEITPARIGRSINVLIFIWLPVIL